MLRGGGRSVAYIGGGAGRAEGETAEEGAGGQGLRVHGARVCHGHDGAAIPLPPKLRKFLLLLWFLETKGEERKGRGEKEARRSLCGGKSWSWPHPGGGCVGPTGSKWIEAGVNIRQGMFTLKALS